MYNLKRRKLIATILALVMFMTVGNFGVLADRADAADALTIVTPALVVTGAGVLGGAAYSETNVSYEKSYTLAELKALETVQQLYSALNSSATRSIYLGEGIYIKTLLGGGKTAVTETNAAEVFLNAKRSFSDAGRYYYPNIGMGNDTGAVLAPSMIAWSNAKNEGKDGGGDAEIKEPKSADLKTIADGLTFMMGQTERTEVNNSMYFRGANTLQVGQALTGDLITIKGEGYTRAEILLKERADSSYTYTTKKGTFTDYVRGVPLKALVDGAASDQVISFTAADGYDMSDKSVSVADAIANNYILAYEKGTSAGDLQGIYETGTDGNDAPVEGYFTLYGDGINPAKLIDSIKIDDAVSFTDSPYKHITNGGLGGGVNASPYNLDAITGATLTVEGPGVAATTPIAIRELEATDNANIYRGDYTDSTGEKTYEGVTVLSIVDGAVNKLVAKYDDNVSIVFKNRWRQTIATIPYSQLKTAATPVILAYGVGTKGSSASFNETTGLGAAPFVYDLSPGYHDALKNADGCLRLVFDHSAITGTGAKDTYASVAYIYVERGTARPGYKHSEAADVAYSNVGNTEYLVTFTGQALGREVNYTVEELEDMVEYEGGALKAGGLGHRAEYGLSNTTYWYVNEYEGIKLWELLTQKMGLDAATYQNDANTLVSFASWDNYQTTAQFSMKQLADPSLFYFYEKSPLDIGTDRPTKAELATEEFQPDNLLNPEQWTKDYNGYPIKTGYPVMLAYGVNGYPYVKDAKMDGFAGGLGNDGGPLRVIFGKANDMNRSNPGAEDNYAYFYNNGSNQLQRAQEIYVGDDTRYSTHMENPAAAYQAMKDTPAALTVEVISNGQTTTKTYTLAQLESILYGPNVSKRILDTQGRQEKGYYYHKGSHVGPIEDLFEGVNLEYLLTEDIGLPGVLGSVHLFSGDNTTTVPDAVLDLTAIGEEGYNSLSGTSGLGMMVAFAENGYPLVETKESDGYVNDDPVTGKTIKNNNGPLLFLRPQTAAENAANALDENEIPVTVDNLKKIVVNLEADVYAHTGETYGAYAAQNLKFSGAVASDGGVNVSIGTLETKQKYMVTDQYTIGGTTAGYRGLNLYRLLNDSSIGASAMMVAVKVKNASGDSTELDVTDLTDAAQNIILAYGITGAANATSGGLSLATNASSAGLPLVPTTTSAGYDPDYKNAGGPLRLVINGGTQAQCITDVTEIEVIKSAAGGWTHSFGNYEAYKNDTLEISGANLSKTATYTVAQLEAMDNIKVTGPYQMGTELYFEGVDLYKLLQNVGFASGLDTSDFTVYSTDGYSTAFTGTDLKNGVNGKPMLIAYGQGVSTTNGLPLVKDETSPGFDPNIGNAYGPLRLVVHDNTGWCAKWVSKVVVGASGDPTPPPGERDFNIYGLEGGTVAYGVGGDSPAIKNLPEGKGKVEATYNYNGESVAVKGAYLIDILADAGVSGDNVTITVNTTDGFEENTEKAIGYRDIPLSDISGQKYFVAYDVNGEKVEDKDKTPAENVAAVRIYRNYDGGAEGEKNNQMKCVKGVTVSGMDSVKVLEPPFTIKGLGSKDLTCAVGGKDYDILLKSGITGTTSGRDGKQTASYKYTSSDKLYTDYAYGVYMTDLLEVAMSKAGVSGIALDSPDWFVTIYTTDNFGHSSYQMIPFSEVKAKDYFIAYNVSDKADDVTDKSKGVADVDKNGVQASVRVYRHQNDGGNWQNRITNVAGIEISTYMFNTWLAGGDLPNAGVRTVEKDAQGGTWVGTYGGGLAHKAAGANSFTVYDTQSTPALQTGFVSAVAVDAGGGVWFSQNASYTEPGQNRGVGYLKDGNITWYRATDDPTTIPDDYVQAIQIDSAGAVWFGSFGGITKFDGSTWKTWSEAEGLPAASVNTITFDGKGGVWIGCYPNGAGTQDDLFKGGYAHLNAAGTIDFAQSYTGEYSEIAQSSLLADVWVRGIAADADGNAWIIRSGSYSNMPTSVGGRLDYVAADGNTYKVTSYTGNDLLGDNLTPGSELRVVDVDKLGGIWFGTTVDGVIHCSSVGANTTVKQIYNDKTYAWPASAVLLNNVYFLEFFGDELYAGGSGGVAYATIDVSKLDPGDDPGDDPGPGPGPGPGGDNTIGDATADTAEFSITGAVEKPGYFTIKGLKNAKGMVKSTKTYSWLNSYGTVGKDTFTGVYLEDLLTGVMTLRSNAKSITVTAGDGYHRSFNLDRNELGVYWSDIEGNKMMLAWEQNGDKCDLKLVIGQTGTEHVNKPMWVSGIVSIEVVASSTSPGSGTPGKYEGGGTPAGGGGTPEEAAVTQTVTSEVKTEVTVNNGVAAAKVTAKELTAALKEVNAAAGTGTAEKVKKAVTINATTKEAVTKAEVELPRDVMRQLAAEESVAVVIQTNLGDIELPAEVVKELAADGQPLSIAVAAVDKSTLSAEEQALVGERPAVEVTITSGGKAITSFGDKLVKSSIKYEAPAEENSSALLIYYLDGSGQARPIKLSAYDAGQGMKYATNHESIYAVGYNEVSFTDLNAHWAQANVEFLAARDIVNGYEDNSFAADGNVTRAEFVKLLASSMDGIEVSGARSAGFTDVASSDWYADYVNWAAANGIAGGFPDGSFMPNEQITREQMAVMSSNFIQAMKVELKVVNQKSSFSDQASISDWATTAVLRMQQYGIINGNPDGSFRPQGTATRAEAATIIKGYIEAVLS